MNTVGRLLGFGYAIVLRVLVATGGAIAAYGATAMFTSAGVEPPNIIVIVGVVTSALIAIALWTRERRLDGIWPALMVVGIPYALYAFGSWATTECPADHPPITPTYSCSPVGTHAIAIVAPLLALVGLALLVRDVRALARR